MADDHVFVRDRAEVSFGKGLQEKPPTVHRVADVGLTTCSVWMGIGKQPARDPQPPLRDARLHALQQIGSVLDHDPELIRPRVHEPRELLVLVHEIQRDLEAADVPLHVPGAVVVPCPVGVAVRHKGDRFDIHDGCPEKLGDCPSWAVPLRSAIVGTVHGGQSPLTPMANAGVTSAQIYQSHAECQPPREPTPGQWEPPLLDRHPMRSRMSLVDSASHRLQGQLVLRAPDGA